MTEKINLSTQKVNQLTPDDEDITPAGLCKSYFQTDKDGRRFIRTFAIANLLYGAESLSDANTIMCNSLAQVQMLVQEFLDCAQERKEPRDGEPDLRRAGQIL